MRILPSKFQGWGGRLSSQSQKEFVSRLRFGTVFFFSPCKYGSLSKHRRPNVVEL